MIGYAKFIGIFLALVMLQACKIQITAPEGGSVISRSGANDCASGRVCRVDVPNFRFADTFTAVPKPGYVFTGWVSGRDYFCGGGTVPCPIRPGPFTTLASSDNPTLVRIYEVVRDVLADSSKLYHLTPVFMPEGSRSATLSWSVPTTRANGSLLAPSELAGYEIYITTEKSGTSTVVEIPDPLKFSHKLRNLAPDTYHFAVSALDTNGMTSELSRVVTKTIP
ncbi:MAG: fibronectin type III domain-containing protein [Pseudomonadales bacterium]|nr:fibronectin type III domain-containing protein [Pseudomonadales bacterium]